MPFEPPIIPAPVQPISYMTPAVDYRRPGILTAVGILSIVLGGFSALSSIGGIFSAFSYMMMSKISIPMPAVIPATAPTTTFAVGSKAFGINVTSTTVPPMRITPTRPFRFNINPHAYVLTGVESFLSFLVAVLLLFAGILMLRDSPRAPRLHWIYIVLKIPLIILAAIATWMTYTSFMANVSAAAPGGGISSALSKTIMIVPAFISAFFSLIYPVSLMIVLSTSAVKMHFQTLKFGAPQ